MSAHSGVLTEDERAFLQYRVSRFELVSGLVFGGFLVFRLALNVLSQITDDREVIKAGL